MVSSTLPKIRLYYYGTSSRIIVFIRFLGELKTPKIHFEINWPLTAPKNSCSFIFCDNSYWSQVTSISSYKLNIFRNRTCRTCICHIPGILQYVYMTNMRHELFREGYLLLAFLKRVHILANLSMILAFHFLCVTHA